MGPIRLTRVTEERAHTRVVAVWPHATRTDARDEVAAFVAALARENICCLAPEDDCGWLSSLSRTAVEPLEASDRPCELAVIFGGDGSILRAAEWALPRRVPLLGVNLGHVGFLAELEQAEHRDLVAHVRDRAYTVEERLTIGVEVRAAGGDLVWSSEAVNEVSLEKAARERMVEVLVAIDGRPLSRWGCDGVLVSTPTGSTAYAFSAGGPVVWPDVAALLVVPLSAHALFSRPVVIGPDCRVDITVTPESASGGVVWCDGRRTTTIQEGMSVTVRRGRFPLRLARMNQQPFTDRLVKKFDLPVDGWRRRIVAEPDPGREPRQGA